MVSSSIYRPHLTFVESLKKLVKNLLLDMKLKVFGNLTKSLFSFKKCTATS